ncbi:glycosyltransferase [Paracoccus sp. Ld10]|uniref:glycosyltransferase n=1 Tax=Paracoccus sp. Ld10 TaxID=649158 RepID=UPI003864BF2B
MTKTVNQVTIAIPVRDEGTRIGRLLAALAEAAQGCGASVSALVLANDCVDDSIAVAQSFSHPALRVRIREMRFPTGLASAGKARRVAMDMAVQPGGLLMTTDADAVPNRNWIAAALEAVRAGADLVCGAITAEAPHVLATRSGARITKAEIAHAALQNEIRHGLDQIAGRQPMGGVRPHYVESGASMAIRADSYISIGGLPARDHSEDRALVHLAEMKQLRICYASSMTARVSARLNGRAEGGMAACLRHRMQHQNPLADQAMLPPELLQRMWAEAMATGHAPYPCRCDPPGLRLRASDLEAAYPALCALVEQTVRPDIARLAQSGRVALVAQ